MAIMASGATLSPPSSANLQAQRLTCRQLPLRPVLGLGGRRVASRRWSSLVIAGEGSGGFSSLPNSNYVVPMDKADLGIIRPLGEILRDLNKKVTGNIVNKIDKSIPWYHANRLLSFYAPGWCGEIRNVIFSDDGTVTVIYRVTVRGIDGEREEN
ncbi:cobalt ion-binding protein isoform X2 [Wolffia australiana]